VGLTLRYPYEVRDEKPYFEDIPELKTPKEMLDLAVHIVETKSGHFDPAQFEDRYENALVDLLKKKEAGEKIEPAKEGPAPQVVWMPCGLASMRRKRSLRPPAPRRGGLLERGPARSESLLLVRVNHDVRFTRRFSTQVLGRLHGPSGVHEPR
jgi:DNA end-binding protein Ku